MLPVEDNVRHHHASPRAAVGFLLHAASLDLGRLGARRALTMPGVSVTVAEQIEALRRVARRQGGGADPARARRDDPPHRRRLADASSTPSAREALGFKAETDFDDIIRAHIEDEHV